MNRFLACSQPAPNTHNGHAIHKRKSFPFTRIVIPTEWRFLCAHFGLAFAPIHFATGSRAMLCAGAFN